MGSQRPFVLRGATNLKLRYQIFRVPTRVCIRESIIEPVAQHTIVEEPVSHAVTPSAARYHVRGGVHVLHASSDGRIHRAHQDFVCGRDDCLCSGATDPIYGHRGDFNRQSSVDRCLTRRIHLVTGLHGISHNHRADLLRPQARPLESGADSCSSELDGRHVLQGAAECSDSGTDWFGDYDRVH